MFSTTFEVFRSGEGEEGALSGRLTGEHSLKCFGVVEMRFAQINGKRVYSLTLCFCRGALPL